MRITQIGHACALVETHGISILSDPWWKGPCFGAQWWVYPRPRLDVLDTVHPDYIYVSHGHHDHLHPGTLRTLPKTAVILVARELGLGKILRDLGFEVIEAGSGEVFTIGPAKDVRCRIVQTHGDDSLLAIDDGERVCININDALHSAPHESQDRHIARLVDWYPRIDYVLCGYGIASHFPNCYVLPGKDDVASARQRQRYFNREWARVVHGLKPRYGFPFAADVVLLEEPLFWTNVAVHNGERPVAAFAEQYPQSAVRTLDIAPGFTIDGDQIVASILRTPLSETALRAEMADGIRRSNLFLAPTPELFDEVASGLRSRVECHRDALQSAPVDYRLLVRFHNGDQHLSLVKSHGDVVFATVSDPDESAYDLIFRTRLAYLKWALQEPLGDEILFVGSGAIFEYRSAALVAENVHREWIALLRDNVPTRRRPGLTGRAIRTAKGVVNRLLGRGYVDLYDLNQWTVYSP